MLVVLRRAGARLTQRIRLMAFTTMVRQDMAFFDEPAHSTGALSTQLAVDAALLAGMTGTRLSIFIQAGTNVIASAVIAILAGWKLALALLACLPLIVMSGT